MKKRETNITFDVHGPTETYIRRKGMVVGKASLHHDGVMPTFLEILGIEECSKTDHCYGHSSCRQRCFLRFPEDQEENVAESSRHSIYEEGLEIEVALFPVQMKGSRISLALPYSDPSMGIPYSEPLTFYRGNQTEVSIGRPSVAMMWSESVGATLPNLGDSSRNPWVLDAIQICGIREISSNEKHPHVSGIYAARINVSAKKSGEYTTQLRFDSPSRDSALRRLYDAGEGIEASLRKFHPEVLAKGRIRGLVEKIEKQ
ncbi:hypothetical protein HYX14_06270 [Candidatus Woesearchaeota archaeon]|nr:hypothetical protein [Candidatus Woesearchaeota archaeon]